MASHDLYEENLKSQCLQLLSAYLLLDIESSVPTQERGGDISKRKEGEQKESDKNHESIMKQVSEHQIASGSNIEKLVPEGLPTDLRQNSENIKCDDIRNLYDIDSGVHRVENGDISVLDLVTIHLRSYKNILDIELSDMSVFRGRFIRYFNEIFFEIIDRCMRERRGGGTDVVSKYNLLVRCKQIVFANF